MEVSNQSHCHPAGANLVSNNLRDYRASKSWLLMAVTLCLVILTGSFFLDGAAARLINEIRTPGLTTAMNTITVLGELSVLVLVVACVSAIGSKDLGRRAGLLAALALLSTGFCVLVVKLLAARSSDGEFHFFWHWDSRAMMFPSGHAAMVCAVAVVFGRMYRSFRWPLVVIALAVAMSRVYLVHFLSDVVAGLLLGLSVSSLILSYAARWKYIT
jgi:membrane-associated phospholipid phosphatase